MNRFQNTRQPDWDWWSRLWPAPGETLRKIGVRPGETLVEICSGNGYFALPAARIAAPETVYAVDIDTALLKELSHLADQQGIENISPIAGDARTLSEQLPESVDLALVANTFHGIDETTPFVRQAVESLRPDGRFIIINWRDVPRETTRIGGDPRGPPTELRLSPEETEQRVLNATATTLEQTIELPPYHLIQRGSPVVDGARAVCPWRLRRHAVHGGRESRKLRGTNNTQQRGQLPMSYKHSTTSDI